VMLFTALARRRDGTLAAASHHCPSSSCQCRHHHVIMSVLSPQRRVSRGCCWSCVVIVTLSARRISKVGGAYSAYWK
jgi:hypothetical protein